jgi:tetratricopeptide (TPR) repeat protein
MVKMRVLSLLVIYLLSFSLRADNASSEYNRSITLYQNGKTKEAIRILKEISPSVNVFKESLETLGKIYYKQEDYARLFALTTFYRSKYKNTSDINLDLLALEIFSLSKLCQFESANSLMDEVENLYKDQKEVVKKIKNSLLVMKEYSIYSKKEAKVKREKYSWKLDRADLYRLKTPHNLRIKVENKCR